MRNSNVFQNLRRRLRLLPFFVGGLAVIVPANAAEKLPFDPNNICRLSVDHIPRSIAIRQGRDIWLGYDLEKALVFKVWQASSDKPGISLKAFKAQSVGSKWFEEQTAQGWQLAVAGKAVPLAVRYLGCTQTKGHFELRWELSHHNGTITLSERIPMAPKNGKARAYREVRAESLQPGALLMPPPACRKAWTLQGPGGKPAKALSGPAWYQLFLP